ARWDEASVPMWVDGSAGGFSPLEDIWALFTESARPSLTLDGVVVPGEPFDDPGWVDRLPGGLGSAHAALAEVRVEPA
ncbi:MAG TPA: hypothetical protein VFO78_03605, partial [Candidatus Limnocylindrales bacterium]|nr:hypothetical protein [Candidatus Limnocylindrales bacterium]